MKNKYCVYAHYRKDNGEIFYIGQGTLIRAKCTIRKLKTWNKVVEDACGFIHEILKDNLTKDEALELEEKLILEYGPKIVNLSTSSSKVKTLDFDTFNNMYYVDVTSKTCLRYKQNVYAHDYGDIKYSIIHKQGDVAGNKGTSGWQVCLKGKNYRVHRIVYLLTNGGISEDKVIDHIDGNHYNNLPSNLRQVDHTTNRRNTKVDKRSVTSVTGVSYASNNKTYRASISSDVCRIARSFSVSKYGEQEAFRLACEWRKEQIKLLNEQGAGYTDRHGT
jgi:hypothetical protein